MIPDPSPAPGIAARALIGLLAGWFTVSACTPVPDRFEPVADVKDLMISVLEPAAETYWDGVGEILDEDGVHEIRPQTDEDWEALRNAAFVIAESGNLLMMSGRARDLGPWADYSRVLVETGREALVAADLRDAEAVFDAGAEVYYACSECHAAYVPETLRPSDPRSVAVDETAPSVDGTIEPGS